MAGEEAEPGKYFQGGQWFSVKQGDWVDPTTEIKMNFMKKVAKGASEGADALEKGSEVLETASELVEAVENGVETLEEAQEVVEKAEEILEETEEFIEKIEAVEKLKKESIASEAASAVLEGGGDGTGLIGDGVDIVIHAAEDVFPEADETIEITDAIQEEVKEIIEEKIEETIQEKIDAIEEKSEEALEEKEEQSYDYKSVEETCEDEAKEDEADAEAYYRENGYTKREEEKSEDTQSVVSIFATVGDSSKTVFQAGEPLTNGHSMEEGEDLHILGSSKVVEAGVVLGDNEAMSRSGSVRSTKSYTGSVKSIKSVKSNSGTINGEGDDNEAMSRSGSVRSMKSVKSRSGSIKSSRSSVRSVKGDRPTILEGSIFETRDVEVEDDNVSVKTLTEEDTDVGYEYIAKEDTESLMGDEEKDPDTYYKENGYGDGDGDGDNVSIISYDVQGDYIPSLHQKVGEEPKKVRKAEPPATKVEPETDETPISMPEPAPREAVQKAPVQSRSYEEERATQDFENIVRQNQEKYKSEKSQSNTEVGLFVISVHICRC